MGVFLAHLLTFLGVETGALPLRVALSVSSSYLGDADRSLGGLNRYWSYVMNWEVLDD